MVKKTEAPPNSDPVMIETRAGPDRNDNGVETLVVVAVPDIVNKPTGTLFEEQ